MCNILLSDESHCGLYFPHNVATVFKISGFVVLRLVSVSWVSFFFFVQPNDFANLDLAVLKCKFEFAFSFSEQCRHAMKANCFLGIVGRTAFVK